jgi:hypothetical protein
MPNNYWTKENVLRNSLKYDNKIKWRENDNSAYVTARNNGWLDECCKHMIQNKPKGYWTKEICINSALKYNTPSDWEKGDNSACTTAKFNGWYKECTVHMTRKTNQFPRGYWTKEKCIESALKYNTHKEWIKNDNAALCASKLHGWHNECISHMKKLKNDDNYWTKEKCLEDALKYNKPSEWAKNNQYSYNKAKKNGWFKECLAHMIHNKEPKYTYEKCLNSALNYSLLYDWRMNDRVVYNAAWKNGWLEKIKNLHFNKK